jgi:hypothetical protein
MREKKSGALSRMQKLRKRLSHSFGRLSVSKEDSEDHNHGKLPYNGYSDEFLDRLEPNGNIPAGKGDIRYGECLVKGNDVVCSLTHGETERPPYIPVYGQFNLFWRTIAHTGLIRN